MQQRAKLYIDSVTTPGGGLIGMTLCPGKQQRYAMSGSWQRNLDDDIAVIRDWGAAAVVTLMESFELEVYGVGAIGRVVAAHGMRWLHLPIEDVNIPDTHFERAWAEQAPGLHARLRAGGRILLHCLGGLGRTGTIAARLLVELGASPADAITAVRRARPGTIQTPDQEIYVYNFPRVPSRAEPSSKA